jgi:large subunit ribosomal protein L25
VTLKHGSETQKVIAKAVDMHPVTDEPWHFDLYRVDVHQTVKIAVPVHFQNQEDSPGLKRGGTLNIALHEIALSVPADEIPEDIIHDLTGLDIGDSIRIGDLKLPGSAQAVLDASVVVATITGASAQMAEEAAAEAAEGGAA